MNGSTAFGLFAILVLVLGNGFFVATEFALVAVRRSRLEQLAREGNARARLAHQMVRHLDAYIAACQLGITMASLALGWIGEPALAHLLEPPIEGLVGTWAPAAAHAIAVGVAFFVITGLHIVAGELAPKGIALQHPETTTLWVARPFQLFYMVFRWPITGLNAVGNAVLRLIGLRTATSREMVHSAEELALLVQTSQRAGAVEESEARIASRAFHFADLTAGDLMTPRTEVEGIPVGVGREALLERVAASRASRLPVYDGTLDNILGLIRIRDVVSYLAQPNAPLDMRALIRPVLTVPVSRQADYLLEDMRKTPRHMAVVIDEYGGTAGIVTLADLMRALVGPIDEETAGLAEGASPQADGSIVVDGLTRVHELEEMLGIEVDEATRDAVSTVGGLIMAKLDRMPRAGDEVALPGHRLRVDRLDGRRVASVRIDREPPRDGRPAGDVPRA